MAIAYVTTLEGGQKAIVAGVDGLAHLFFDRQPDTALIDSIVTSGSFVIPTLVALSSAFGNNAAWLAADKRVSSRLSRKWLGSLSRSMNVFPQGDLKDVYAGVMALHKAGVDLLVDSDVSEPIPILGGLAHGVSLHHELKLLVAAGLEPIEALCAATSTPARRFGLSDRGRIVPGARAKFRHYQQNFAACVRNILSNWCLNQIIGLSFALSMNNLKQKQNNDDLDRIAR